MTIDFEPSGFLWVEPNDADAFNNRGNVRRAKGDVDGAIQDYTEAIRLKPDYVLAFNNRGNVRHAKGDVEGALQDYNEAIRLKPLSVIRKRSFLSLSPVGEG